MRNATIARPGKFASLKLATGVNGQSLVVRYTDGTSTTAAQSFSDWHTSQSFAGELIAASMSYRLLNGSPHVYHVYGIAVDPSKMSLTLPDNTWSRIRRHGCHR